MAFEAIERLQLEYTDKYVIVTGRQPELARFEGVVGQVKTVNMSGRALIEFTGWHKNTGWHDIELSALKVVDKPVDPDAASKARAASKIPPAKGSVKSAADVLALARGKGKPDAAPKPDAAGRSAKRVSPSAGKNPADILAAARAGKAASKPAAPSKAAKPAGKKTSPATKLATADILAAARGKKPAPTAAPSTPESTSAPQGASKADVSKPAGQADPKPATPRKKLTAADILAIASGKLSNRRDQVVANAPLDGDTELPDAGGARPAALPKPTDRRKLTAADIRALGERR